MTEPLPPGPATRAAAERRSTWTATWVMAVGIVFFGLAFLPSLLSGASNPYVAVLLVVLGLVSFGVAVAFEVRDLLRPVAGSVPAAIIALISAIPVWMPIFQPVGSDLVIPALYVLAIGLLSFGVRQSPPSLALLLLTLIGPAVYAIQLITTSA